MMRRFRRRGEQSVARVTVLSRVGCHLCETVIDTVARVCSEVNETYEVVDVDGDPSLLERYSHEVPVIFVDGKQHDFFRVDATRLAKALAI